MRILPLPPHYDPANARNPLYKGRENSMPMLADRWRRDQGVQPWMMDHRNSKIVRLLLIDMQYDFCFPPVFQGGEQVDGGTLYVGGRSGTGAMDDCDRIAQFIYRNMGVLTHITATLDSHWPFQIFFAPVWMTKQGGPLNPHTLIVLSPDGRSLNNMDLGGNVLHEDVGPNPAVASFLGAGYGITNPVELKRYFIHYCTQLKNGGQYTLYLWPFHCQVGTPGHALAGVVREAQLFHALTRNVQAWAEIKGSNPLSERYGVLEEEVTTLHDGRPLAQLNTALIGALASSDAVVIAGEAASHCDKSTIEQVLRLIVKNDRSLAEKMYLLRDGMSSVVVPDGKGGIAADFTPQAEQALDDFARAGMNVVESTTPMADWPGVMSKIVA